MLVENSCRMLLHNSIFRFCALNRGRENKISRQQHAPYSCLALLPHALCTNLEQDKGLLGYYFLEEHMLSCHTVHCRDDPAVPRNKWPPPEVWESLQAVTPICANRNIQGKPFPLASLLLFSGQDHFQHVLQWGLSNTALQQDWWEGEKKYLKAFESNFRMNSAAT